MLRPSTPTCPWLGLCALLVVATAAFSTVRAQTLTLQNGATLHVQDGAVWKLHGTTVDLGGTSRSVRLAETNGGRLTGGILTATRNLAAPDDRNVAGLGAVLDANRVLGITTITRGHSVQTGNGNPSVARYYDITPTTNAGLGATLTFTYHDAELNGLSESQLELFRSADGGATWSDRGADDRDPSANTVTLSSIDTFSRWTLGSRSQPLPVELAGFEAQAEGPSVRLRWRTVSETNNTGFEVQRSTNGTTYSTIGEVDGAGTTTEPHVYRFRDRSVPYTADSLVYRLRQIDTDGSAHLSPTLTIARQAPEQVRLTPPFPNPARQQATVRYEVPTAASVTLHVFDVLGREVTTLTQKRVDAGRHSERLSTTDLAPGTYLVRLTANGQSQTRQLVVVH